MKFYRSKNNKTEGRAIDPALRARIEQFIEERFEDEDLDRVYDSVEITAPGAPDDADALEDAGVSVDADSAPMVLFDIALHSDQGYSVGSAPAESMPCAESEPISFTGGPHAPSIEEQLDAPGLEAWLDKLDEPFSTTLLAIIDRKGLTDADVYKRAGLSRQHFSQIRSNPNYRPKKDTALALCVALQLSVEETRSLLERAGFALSNASKRDIIVEYFLENKIYDLITINQSLFAFDQPLL